MSRPEEENRTMRPSPSSTERLQARIDELEQEVQRLETEKEALREEIRRWTRRRYAATRALLADDPLD